MKTKLRCYIRPVDGVYVAVCVDLDLATQGDSMAEAKQKLKEQMQFYIEDALTEPPEVRRQLLCRKAPLSERVRFRLIKFMHQYVFSKKEKSRKRIFVHKAPALATC